MPSILFSKFSFIFIFCFSFLATSAHSTPEKKPADTKPEAKPVKVIKSHGLSLLGTPLKYDEDFKHFDYVNAKAPKGGTLKLHEVGTFDNLNPYIIKGRPGASTTILFDTLMVGNADEINTYYGLIAETIELAEDKSFIIFNLRKKARWHDGTPITSDDVIFSHQILMEHSYPSYRSLLKMIVKIEALNKHRVKFVFDKEHLDNRDLLAIPASMPILPKAYYSKNEFNKTTLSSPMGSGPYMISKVDAGHSLTYSRVQNYWAKDLPVNVGLFNFDIIHIDYYKNGQVAFEAFKSGQYDIRQEMASKRWALEYDFPAIKSGKVTKASIPHKNPVGTQAIYFNIRKDKFKDRKVREALTLAFDFEWLNKTQFYGRYQRLLSAFENSPMAAHSKPSKEELALLEPHKASLPPEVFTKAYILPVHDGSGRIRKTLFRASKLLKSAGWTINKQGQRVNSKGQVFELEFLIYNQMFEKIYQPYIKNLKKLGIDAKLKLVDITEFSNRRKSFDFDVLALRWSGSLVPGIEQHMRWHSTEAKRKGSPNLCGLNNPAVDDLVKKLMSSKQLDEITTISRALDRVLMWNYYFIPMYYKSTYNIAYWNHLGRPEHPPYATMVGSTITEPVGSAHMWWSKKKSEKRKVESKLKY